MPFLRPAARGRVRKLSIGLGLPPSPSRSDERTVYYSPSTRATMGRLPPNDYREMRWSCLRNVGDPERFCYRSGRRSGERGGPSTRNMIVIAMSSNEPRSTHRVLRSGETKKPRPVMLPRPTTLIQPERLIAQASCIRSSETRRTFAVHVVSRSNSSTGSVT